MKDHSPISYKNAKKQICDQFGNLLYGHDIKIMMRDSSGNWSLSETQSTLSGYYYVVDNQVYYRLDDKLCPLNMDLNNPKHNCCYVIDRCFENPHKITGNRLLKVFPCNYTLHCQTYSDCPPFYYLKDAWGQFAAGFGDNDLQVLLSRLQKLLRFNSDFKEAVKAYQEELLVEIGKQPLSEQIEQAVSGYSVSSVSKFVENKENTRFVSGR